MSGGAVLNDGGKLIGIGAYREDDESAYYAVSSLIARRIMEKALRGEADKKSGEVMLFGRTAFDGGYGAYLYDEYGSVGILAKRANKNRLHALGFSGTFTVEGLLVNAVGADCPVPVGALVTEIGGVPALSAHMSEVFAVLYDYRLTDGAEGNVLQATYETDGETHTAELSGGGFSLTKK